MKTGKADWLSMTRHERRGALVLLALIVAGAVAMWMMRTRPVGTTRAEAEQMQQFERMADSLHQQMDSAKAVKKSHPAKAGTSPKGKKRKSKSRPAKSTPRDRRLDPVPRY